MSITPLRKQYLQIKKRFPDAIVFFRLGDFYETFDEDARITSRELEIVLTSREMGKGYKVPLAGIPYHALENYLARLINRGYKVAICEQMSQPGKGLVERDVIRVVTPGTVIEPGLLTERNNNYLVSLFVEKHNIGIACADITTGEFAVSEMSLDKITNEIARLNPAEIIIPKSREYVFLEGMQNITQFEEYFYELDVARQALLEHFSVSTLEGFGCASLPLAIRAAGAIIAYLGENQKAALKLLTRLYTYNVDSFMTLDVNTIRNLELYTSLRWGTPRGSLLDTIDTTRTAMGGRLLKKYIGQPLLDLTEIDKRQNAVAWFYENPLNRAAIIELLSDMPDIERIINRVRSYTAATRDIVALKLSLEKLAKIKELLTQKNAPEILTANLNLFPDVVELINRSLVDQPPVNFDHGGVIRAGYSEELDRTRAVAHDAKQFLADMEKKERDRTGIKSLKLGYNRVFGYYIEITQANLRAVPANYVRKQTLANGERYYTPELKEYESLILNAQERMIELEKEIFTQLCANISQYGEKILESATTLAGIDVFSALADVAARYGYVRPRLNDGDAIRIRKGRHPVVERMLGSGAFVPNDTFLSCKESQLILLTGPNMAGKSTYLKQVALIVLLAQIGSFVPADEAEIGIVDRIFTRIGAQEDLAGGQSTFMVEMIEVANILNNATSRSLLILDEVGRGTSTYDGLSIAWAVIEYIHNNVRLRCRTLFATHYHELTGLSSTLPRVKNFNMAVTEEEGRVIFLRHVVPGGADKSYGIHVAQLAGLPKPVINRAQEILANLENERIGSCGELQPKKHIEKPVQLSIFGPTSEVEEELKALDIDSISPIEAINKLYELKKKIRDK